MKENREKYTLENNEIFLKFKNMWKVKDIFENLRVSEELENMFKTFQYLVFCVSNLQI